MYKLASCLLLAAAVVATSILVSAQQQAPQVMSETIIPMRSQLRLHPFSTFPKPEYSLVDGAVISIEVGYVQGKDRLLLDYQGDFNIDAYWDDRRGTLYLQRSAPSSEYLDAISKVVFYTESEDWQPRRITWSLGRHTFYNSLTRHMYKFMEAAVPFEEAVVGCQRMQLFGMQGYLATVTSSEEQYLLSTKSNYTAWIGLATSNDTVRAEVWKWVDGPEKGKVAWTGLSMYGLGYPTQGVVEPSYTAWGRFQPESWKAAGSRAFSVAIVQSAYDPVAFWHNKGNDDNVLGYVCEYGGMDTDPAVANAMLSRAGTVVLDFSCSNFTTAGDCMNRAQFGCSWDSTQCRQTTCRVHQSEQACNGDSRCAWNTDIDVSLIGRCVNTRCSAYSNADACSADPVCYAKPVGTGATTCVLATCKTRQTPCACGSLDGCRWDQNECKFEQALGCNKYDIVFLLDATQEMSQPFLTFSQGFRGLTDVFAASQFALTGTAAGVPVGSNVDGQRLGFVRFGDSAGVNVKDGGAMITGDYAAVDKHIAWLQAGYTSGSSSRNLADGLKLARTMLANDGSATARRKVVVVFAAGPISDASLAKTAAANLALDGALLLGVALKPTEPGTLAGNQATASLAALGFNTVSAEMDDVQDAAIYGLCSRNTTFGKFIANAPLDRAIMCSASTNPDDCRRQNPMCAWSYATDMCVASQCTRYCDPLSCSADSVCKWHLPSGSVGIGMCMERCAGNTQGQCSTFISSCFWNKDQGICEAFSCTSNPNEDACLADPFRCQYNESAIIKCKPPPCSNITDSGACDASPHCRYTDASGCIRNPCAVVAANYKLCAMNPECQWNDNASKCELHFCATFGTEHTCNENFNCAWNISFAPAACMPALCTGYNNLPQVQAEQMCNGNPADCRWVPAANGNRARCELRRCDANMRACDCAKMPQCVWRGGQCKDSRYVACPGIDVVFLVEATPKMNLAFGRHPNGFIGIVESIRSWSKEAPMTTNPAEAGFRFGIVLYGQNTAYPVPNANDITGDATQWLGVNKALDLIIKGGVDYGAKAGPRNNIYDGMLMAKDIFQNHANDAGNRAKLLIVLGSEPITDGYLMTDGAEIVRGEIKRLEAMGVKIFTNVIRRFSTITPGDLDTRMYIEPIASDPQSVHFLFTTIDDMRKTLLDKFCDPSTNTGKILKISRDDTLPCSWLDGQRECGMQGTCYWNASARASCPRAGQCPNLGCISLPDAIAKKFSCDNCQINRGALECSVGRQAPPQRGLCMAATTCLTQCDTTNCTAVAGGACAWQAGSTRCERDWCKTYADRLSCNGDSGCFWDEVTGAPTCRRTDCWRYRAEGTCLTPMVPDGAGGGQRIVCNWRTAVSPAVCEERRCDNLAMASCQADPVACNYVPSNPGRKCVHKKCAYTLPDECEIDRNCYWHPYNLVCMPTTDDCVISGFSDWSPCTATCGEAVRYRTRKVIKFWSGKPGTSSCEMVQKSLPINPGQTSSMAETVKCTAATVGTWNMDCTAHCASKGSAAGTTYAKLRECMLDKSCQWQSGACVPKPLITCQLKDKTACDASDLCGWDTTLNFCLPTITPDCQLDQMSQCKGIQFGCQWRTGATANSMASGMGVDDITLFNPGQNPVFVFPALATSSSAAATTNISGATVMIETAYQMDKDVLALTLPTSRITASFLPTQGVLVLTGLAPITDYFNAISLVTFETTSTSAQPRTITWALGTDTVFATVTGHLYRAYTAPGITWPDAATKCATTSMHGRIGYLATVTSDGENDVVSTKMLGSGWLGADNGLAGAFRWSTGPEAGTGFWSGGSLLLGGAPLGSAYANWNPDTEPRLGGAGALGLYLNLTGYWAAKELGFPSENGYICEFGGLTTDVPLDYPAGGSTIFGVGGCMPITCAWHKTRDLCMADPDCDFQMGFCLPGCQARSTVSECSSNTRCYWNSDVLPPICSKNPCGGLGALACETAAQCLYDVQTGICRIKTGCAALASEADCNGKISCKWHSTDKLCRDRQCPELTQASACMQNPLCEWAITGTCVAVLCKYPDSATCARNAATCYWSNATSAGAVPITPNVGNKFIFQNNGDVVTNGDTTNRVNGITVRIAEGFHIDNDWLSVKTPTDDTGSIYYQWSYNSKTGVLVAYYSDASTVSPAVALQDMIDNVQFSTTSMRDTTRLIEYVLEADSMFSPKSSPDSPVRQNAYLRYVKTDKPILTFQAAKDACTNAKAFGGKPGFPATITNMLDNFGLTALGAQGWLGGVGTDGSWDWSINTISADGTAMVTGTDHFWDVKNGAGMPVLRVPALANAPLYKFAQWSGGQPTPFKSGTKQYAFLLSGGKWMSVVDGTVTTPTGVICQYPIGVDGPAGAAPTVGSSSAYGNLVKVKPEGCFAYPCKGVNEGPCKADPQCRWIDLAGKMGTCQMDTFCATTTKPGICSTQYLCYWDYERGLCRAYSDTKCGTKFKTAAACTAEEGCSWNANLWKEDKTAGGCTATGCAVNPAKATCEANPTCRWFQVDATVPGICVSAVCGYPDPTACWSDNKCFWNRTAGRCFTSRCLSTALSDCASEPTCVQSGDSCVYQRCSSKVAVGAANDQMCLFDPVCLVINGKCGRPNCAQYSDEKTCNADTQCFFFTPLRPSDPKPFCGAAQCTNNPDSNSCGGNQASDACRWDPATGKCRQASAAERTTGMTSCITEVDGNLWWLWFLLAIILLLLGLIIWRLYLAYSKGMSFLDPPRKNMAFTLAKEHAAELFGISDDRDMGYDEQPREEPAAAGEGEETLEVDADLDNL